MTEQSSTIRYLEGIWEEMRQLRLELADLRKLVKRDAPAAADSLRERIAMADDAKRRLEAQTGDIEYLEFRVRRAVSMIAAIEAKEQ